MIRTENILDPNRPKNPYANLNQNDIPEAAAGESGDAGETEGTPREVSLGGVPDPELPARSD